MGLPFCPLGLSPHPSPKGDNWHGIQSHQTKDWLFDKDEQWTVTAESVDYTVYITLPRNASPTQKQNELLEAQWEHKLGIDACRGRTEG